MDHSTKAKTPRPWEDVNGKLLPDSQLRNASRSWSAQTWEEYLTTLEHPQRELCFSGTSEIWNEGVSFNGTPDSELNLEVLSRAVRQALVRLTYRQRRVIDLIYFHGQSVAQVAEELETGRVAISQILARAHHRLAEVLGPRLDYRLRRDRKHFLLRHKRNSHVVPTTKDTPPAFCEQKTFTSSPIVEGKNQS